MEYLIAFTTVQVPTRDGGNLHYYPMNELKNLYFKRKYLSPHLHLHPHHQLE